MSRHRTVLAIDGGGIRGLIPALLLDYLERAAGAPVSDLFDLIVGTSTGGILAMGLAQPDRNSSHRPRYSARALADLYAERGGDIFRRSWWRQVSSLNGTLDETYSADSLEQVLADYFDDTPLAECRCPVMVTAYDIESRETVFLKSFREQHNAIPCAQAARATSAAPTYFEPASVDIGDESRALIDGGIYINAPAVSAYAEALKLFPDDRISLVSLGTGELVEPIAREDAEDWGSAGWVMPLIDCMFDGMAKATDYQMQLFLGERYHRFQLSLDNASSAMDDASSENISALWRAAESLIEAEASRLDHLADHLATAYDERRPPLEDLGRAVL